MINFSLQVLNFQVLTCGFLLYCDILYYRKLILVLIKVCEINAT